MSQVDIDVTPLEQLLHEPTLEQRQIKQQFWSRFQDNQICLPEDITESVALRLVPDNRIRKWWKLAGFQEWFRNQDEFRERTEYLAYLALESLERVLVDPKSQASSVVSAAKLVMELTNKMPRAGAEDKFLDADIAKMTKAEVKKFLERATAKLVSPDQNKLDK